MKKDCWWNNNSKDNASLENPSTPANSTTEPPITGMLIQSDSDDMQPTDLTKWMYSATRHEPCDNDFLIVSRAAPSLCEEKLANSLGGNTHWTWSGP